MIGDERDALDGRIDGGGVVDRQTLVRNDILTLIFFKI